MLLDPSERGLALCGGRRVGVRQRRHHTKATSMCFTQTNAGYGLIFTKHSPEALQRIKAFGRVNNVSSHGRQTWRDLILVGLGCTRSTVDDVSVEAGRGTS